MSSPESTRSGCSRSSTSPSRASQHEQALREELRDAQTKLVERKTIERAKGILMEQKGVSEEHAYRLLRKLAMDRNAKLLDVAQQVVDVAKLLS
jgi:response regulator NasT